MTATGANDNYPGTIDGEFTVDQNGSAVYSIPLQVPPGTAGMQPELSLTYHSSLLNGMLGVGWSLGKLSAIRRAGATPAQDRFRGGVHYDARDRFALDGQRLMAFQGDYGAKGTIYHTEIESWQKVVPVYDDKTDVAYGPASFMVYDRDGYCYEYGTSDDSRIRAAAGHPAIRVWALSKVTDSAGNFMTFKYTRDPLTSAYYPSRVDYTGNSGLTTRRAVVFTYEKRGDVTPSYEAGYATHYTQRLKQIQTMVDGNPVLTYSMDYKQGNATGRSQLCKITMSDAGGRNLSPTLFDWQDLADTSFGSPESLPNMGLTTGSAVVPLDVNGDGYRDLLTASGGDEYKLLLTLLLARPDGKGFSTPVTIPTAGLIYSEQCQLLPLDVNADGCSDLVYVTNNYGMLGLTLFTAVNESGRWTLKQGEAHAAGPADIPWGGQLIPMDIDGDGRIDLVYASADDSGHLELTVLLSSGTRFERTSKTATDLHYDDFIQLFSIDLNGDGMSDLVYAYNNQSRLGLKCFLSSGTQLERYRDDVLPADLALPFGGALMPLNVKEDGNEDLVYACASDDSGELVLYTLHSTGAGFKLASARPDRTGLHYTGSLMPVVVRGPGLTDLLITSADDTSGGTKTVAQLLRCTGSGFAPVPGAGPVKLPLAWGGQTLPLDLRGIGKTDLLYLTTGDEQQVEFTRLPAPALAPDRVNRITNGLGAQFEITYRPITDPSVYARDDVPQGGLVDPKAMVNSNVSGSSWPLAAGPRLAQRTAGAAYTTNSRQFAEYVVSAAVVRDGRGNNYRYEYRYKGARIDLSGHGWLGFAAKESIDTDVGTTTEEEYEQAFPLTYNLKSGSVFRSADKAMMSHVVYDYEHSSAVPGVHRIQANGVTTKHYTFGTLDRTDTVTHKYDSYGNVVLTATKSGAAPAVYTAFAYDETDLNQWQFGMQKEKLVTTDAEGKQVLTREKFINDRRAGRNLESHLWEDQGKRWLVTKYEYDAYGNVTSVTDPAGAVTRSAYDETYRTFAVRKTLPANEAGLALTLGSEYDPRFGVETAHTDANGVKWTNSLDGLGRTVETKGPDPEMKVVALTRQLFGVDNYGYYEETRQLAQWGVDDWRWTRKYYDGLAREYRATAPSDDGKDLIVVDRAHNSKGQVLQETLPYFAGTEPRVITRRYDPHGRMIREEQPIDGGGSRATEVAYPNVDREVQAEAAGTPLARTTTREYATFADKRSLVRSTGATGAVTKYDYDALGRLILATDPNGLAHRSLYDSLNRRVGLTVANDQKTFARETVTYDDLARTVRVRTNNGSETLLKHDSRNRLKDRIVTSPGSEPDHTSYRYDSGDGSLALDRLAQVAMPGGILYGYDYDAHGNVVKETIVLAGQTYRFGKSYTPGGQVARLTYPDGSGMKNRYTVSGHLAEVELTEGGSNPKRYASFEQFTPFGRAGVIKYGNGVTEMAGYNRLGQIKSQTVQGAGGNKMADTSFQWNALHSLTRIEDKLDPKHTQALSYDAVGRLTRATRNADGAAAERLHYDFGYDGAGNLTMKDGVEYSYQGHQATAGRKNGAEVFAADYDSDGSMERVTRDGKTDRYRFDALGCLKASNDATFVYDHTGQRLIKQAANGTTTYYISPAYEVSVLPNGSRQSTKYVPGPYGPIAQITRRLSGPPAEAAAQAISLAGVPAEGVSYFHRNYINSTTLHTDGDGKVLASVQYLPFGEIYSISGSDVFRPKFTGKELDYETGLYYFNARYYDPRIGRFITTDDRLGGSFGAADSLNRYAYVLNNPITGVDFDGHFRWDIFADVLIGIAAVTFIVAGTIATGGLAAPAFALLGSTLLGAAISGSFYSATHSGEGFSWGDWGTEVGIGAATGFVSGVASGAGIAAGGLAFRTLTAGARGVAVSLSRQAASHTARLLITTAVGAAGGMLSGYVGRGFRNLAKGESWNEGWEPSSLGTDALRGAATGFLGGAASVTAKPWLQGLAQNRNVTPGAVFLGGLALEAIAGTVGGLVASHSSSAPPAGNNISPGRPAVRPEPRQSLQFTPRVWLPSMG